MRSWPHSRTPLPAEQNRSGVLLKGIDPMVSQTKPSTPKVEISTIQPGAPVTIDVRDFRYIADVLAVDPVSIKIRTKAYSFDIVGRFDWWPSEKILVIPWRRVVDIEVHEPKRVSR
jgi:hypothetical protein